tara:strand:+ start:761 stop:1384 length:624 start_codon:yes stop_codon:yes gene_type:complete
MSTMTETLENTEALFIPDGDSAETTPKYVPMAEGDHLGHIIEARTITREFTKNKRTVKASIFNFKVKIADENRHNKYHVKGEEIHGENYIGKEIVADGVFRYLEPTNGDTFESNSAENKKYLMFCQSIGMEIPMEKRTINGKTVEVQLLPDLTIDNLNGTPVVAVVGRGQDWTDDEGNSRPSYKVKFTKLWQDGKRIAAKGNDDLPF